LAKRLKYILESRLMSEKYQYIEVVTGVARRGHWSTEAKLRIIEKSSRRGYSVVGRPSAAPCPNN
jgi:hypothetical protein